MEQAYCKKPRIFYLSPENLILTPVKLVFDVTRKRHIFEKTLFVVFFKTLAGTIGAPCLRVDNFSGLTLVNPK